MTSFQIVHHKIILLHSIDFKFQNIDIEQIAIIFYSSLVTSIQDDIVVQAAMLLYQEVRKRRRQKRCSRSEHDVKLELSYFYFLTFFIILSLEVDNYCILGNKTAGVSRERKDLEKDKA